MSFNTIKVNNTDTDYTHSIFDISEYNSGAIYANLSSALATMPQNKKQGGMTVKFIQTISQAQYSVVKTEDLETEPSGTLLSEAPAIDSGTYDESQLRTIFSTLPSDTGAGNALTYYVAVTVDETTTYTSWVITKVQNIDNKYVQWRYMSSSTVVADFTNVANWQGVDDEPTADSNNLVKSGGVYNSQYQKVIKEDGQGTTLISVPLGKFENGEKVYCRFVPWAAGSSQVGTSICQIGETINNNRTAILNIYKGISIPETFEFIAKENAEYDFRGRADVGEVFNGIFTYNCIDKEILNGINRRIIQNRGVVSYNGTNVVIDNETRTISFDGNVAIVNTQGQPITLGTNNKQTTFDAEPTDFSGTYMAVVVLKSNNTLAVKQYDKLAADDYALIGIKFDRPIGSGTTPSTTTKVVSYSSVLPIKFGATLKELSDIVSIHSGIINDYVVKSDVYPCPSSGWNIYPRTINAGDELDLTSSVVREVYTLSSTSSSSSEYRLEHVVLQPGVKKTFNIKKDAVAIMFYDIGNVIVNEVLHDEKITTLENRFNSEIAGEEKKLQYPSGEWHIYPITINQNDTFRINSAVLRQVCTLSSTTNSSSQYRVETFTVYSNEDYIFRASQNAVAIAFYGAGNVSFEKIGTLSVDVENIKSKTRDIIVEKKDSVVGLGNNTITPSQFIGELTPGVKYYVYVNNFKHTSATSGTLFGVGKLGSNIFINVQVGSSLNPPYEFVAEEGKTYFYVGRCDSDDSIEVEFLSRPKESSIDIDAIKKICLNDDQTSLLNSITKSVLSNVKLGGFLHVTDLHSNFASLNEMIRIKSALSLTSVNAMLNSGDIVGGWPKDESGNLVTAISEYMQICENNNKIYHVLGQHEVGFAPSANPNADSGRLKIRVLSHQECFNTYFAPLKSGWGLSSLNKCYYYKDFGSVRLICLYHYNRPEVDDPENPTTMYKY